MASENLIGYGIKAWLHNHSVKLSPTHTDCMEDNRCKTAVLRPSNKIVTEQTDMLSKFYCHQGVGLESHFVH